MINKFILNIEYENIYFDTNYIYNIFNNNNDDFIKLL